MGGDGDRFLEIWNLVFMQYERTADGKLNPLPKPSIDTGMGLERITAIKEGVRNNFDSSTFKPLIDKLESLSPSKIDEKNIGSFRVIADHVRTVSFMLSQGILFDKAGRGYVLRRILRRAVRHGYLLGFRTAFMANIVDTLVDIMGKHYNELIEKHTFINEQVTMEEDRFFHTIASGMELFNAELINTKDIFSGEVAFNLYDTHGFPLDLTEDMLREKNLQVDIETFERCMGEQKAKAKAAWKGSGDDANEGDFKSLLDEIGVNNFIGYENTASSSKIIALLDDSFKKVHTLQEGTTGWVVLDNTPFYATSGGQEGDVGALKDGEHIAIVKETKKIHGINMSQVEVESLTLKVGEIVEAVVVNRSEVAKHHSATHLLQSALRMILGESVSQAGSLNDDKRLRFDFTYPKALTKEQIDEVQDIVNSMIAHAIDGSVEELPIGKAKEKGAIAMFGEKYGDVVRVVEFGDVSVEFCGGTHVKNTGLIGSFYITFERGVSAGVRRIEAVCGLSAINYTKDTIGKLSLIENELKTKEPLQGISKLKEQIKELKCELKSAHENIQSPLCEMMIGNTKVVVDVVLHGDIKKLVDDLKNGNESVAVLLLQSKDEKVTLVSGVKNCNLKAGDWVKAVAPIVGGNGGGRADFASAGGKDSSKVEEAKQFALSFAKENI